METEDTMTVAEAAAALDISVRAVRKRLESGTLDGHNVGGRIWVIPRAEVERWKAQGKLKPGPKPGIKRQPEASIQDVVREEAEHQELLEESRRRIRGEPDPT